MMLGTTPLLSPLFYFFRSMLRVMVYECEYEYENAVPYDTECESCQVAFRHFFHPPSLCLC